MQAMLVEMREILRDTDTKAKQNLLKRSVVWVELGKDRGKVAYTFPLRDADLYTVPPGLELANTHILQRKSASYGSSIFS